MITLSVDLGQVLSEPGLHHHLQPRNGPARQRRREKRAAARKTDAEKVSFADADKASDMNITEKVKDNHCTVEEATTINVETAATAEGNDVVKVEEKNVETEETAGKAIIPSANLREVIL